MAEGNADLSAVLQKLLEDPEMLGRATETAGKLKESGLLDGLLSSESNTGTVREDEAPAPSPQGAYTRRESAYIEGKSGKDLLPIKDAASGEAARMAKERKELLAAVRPFMSRERQERIDGILKILRLLELMQQLGASGIFP